MNPNFTATLLDPGTDFEKLEPYRIKGDSSKLNIFQFLAQQSHQAVSISVQKESELIRFKVVTTETVSF